MNISSRFRQDLGYYLMGVIIPGAINAISVPLLKKLLGTSDFGKYGISYNLLLLLTAFSVGWLCQSIIRFKFTAAGISNSFYKQIFRLGTWVVLILSVSALLINMVYFNNPIAFSLLFSTAIIFCGYQNLLIGLSQANFLSRFTMYTEALRTAVFFILAVTLLKLDVMPSINALFLAIVVSYIASSLLLFKKNKLYTILFKAEGLQTTTEVFEISNVFRYGLPLAGWYLISYLLLFLDKPLLVQHMGYEVQGNYQALYELINKGSVVLLIPVLYALFPLLSNAFENDDIAGGMKLLKKLILIELGIMITGLLAYWLVGFAILQYVLSVPDTFDYKFSGFLMLASILIWQIGMLVHKPFELRKQTNMLLWIVIASLAVFLILLYLVKIYQPVAVYLYTTPFLGASITYVCLCLYLVGYYKKMKTHLHQAKNLVKQKLFD
ncbi:MAG: oligosaccharide flippase family protein [Bacteroidota bacterium]